MKLNLRWQQTRKTNISWAVNLFMYLSARWLFSYTILFFLFVKNKSVDISFTFCGRFQCDFCARYPKQIKAVFFPIFNEFPLAILTQTHTDRQINPHKLTGENPTKNLLNIHNRSRNILHLWRHATTKFAKSF